MKPREELVVSVHGNQNSNKDNLVFIHGWPDDESVWDLLIERFQDDYRCLTFTLPWYGSAKIATETAKIQKYSKWGYSFEAISDMIYAAIVKYSQAKVIVVAHDWGAVYAEYLQARHPEIVSKMILMDVGGFKIDAPASYAQVPTMVLTGLAYQYGMIFAFLFSGRIGRFLARRAAKWAREQAVKGSLPKFKPFANSKNVDFVGECGYPYYYHHRDFILQLIGFKRPQISSIPCPTLFIYGNRKPFQLHNTKWAERIASRENCAVVSVYCGHWVQIEQADEVSSYIEKYLANQGNFSSGQNALLKSSL